MPVSNNSDARWYVIKTARLEENYVGGQLAVIAASESYVPQAKVPKQYLKRGQAQIEPLFPGYAFARLDLTSQLMALCRGRGEDQSLRPDDILSVPSSKAKPAALSALEAAITMGTGIVIWRH